MAGWKMNLLKMYSLLKMGIFQPAMFDYRSVSHGFYHHDFPMQLGMDPPGLSNVRGAQL